MDDKIQLPIFETARYIVRTFQVTDRDNFFSLTGNQQVMQYIRPVKSKKESDEFLDEIMNFSRENPLMGRWAVEDKLTGDFVGSFAIIPMAGEAEKIQLGYSLLPDFWGRGIATELTMAGLKLFSTNFMGQVIYGITEVPNTASQKVLIKAGFEKFGTRQEEGIELLVFINRLP